VSKQKSGQSVQSKVLKKWILIRFQSYLQIQINHTSRQKKSGIKLLIRTIVQILWQRLDSLQLNS